MQQKTRQTKDSVQKSQEQSKRILTPEAFLSEESSSPEAGFYADVSDLSLLGENNYYEIDEGSESFSALSLSIQNEDVKKPILVAFDSSSRRFFVIDGHKRRRCVLNIRTKGRAAPLPLILSIVSRPEEIREAEVASVIANLFQHEHRGIARAHAIRRYVDQRGMKIAEVAIATGLDRKTIERLLNITLLPEPAKALLSSPEARDVREKDIIALAARHKARIKEAEAREEDREKIDEGTLAEARDLLLPRTSRKNGDESSPEKGVKSKASPAAKEATSPSHEKREERSREKRTTREIHSGRLVSVLSARGFSEAMAREIAEEVFSS